MKINVPLNGRGFDNSHGSKANDICLYHIKRLSMSYLKICIWNVSAKLVFILYEREELNYCSQKKSKKHYKSL